MICKAIFVLVAAVISVSTQSATVSSSSTIAPGLEIGVQTGCASWLSTATNCFENHVEVMPLLSIAESTTIASASECQALCVENQNCAYFTYSENPATSSQKCSLKPSAGYGGSPVMMLRRYAPTNTTTTYISGPKICGQKCVEESPIEEQCGASSFASCSQLPVSATFDASCSKNATSCQFEEFPCCRECSGSLDCCSKYNDGKLLDGGAVVAGSIWGGVFSAEHCKTLCYAKDGCTHWNYVTSTMQGFMGGSCFLKRYVKETDIKFKSVESHYKSVYGSTDCEESQTPSETTTAKPSAECFKEKSRAVGHEIFVAFGLNKPADCQKKCQTWPACTNFSIENNHCYIKYGKPQIVADNNIKSVVGPRICDSTKPVENDCLKPDVKLTSAVIGGKALYSNDAVFCYNTCKNRSDCGGWTYKDNDCFLHATMSPSTAAVGFISGSNNCKFPEGTWTRRALGDELTTEESLPSSCVDANTQLVGGDLDVYNHVPTVERCHEICLKRQDCKVITYSMISQMCFIKWGGVVTEAVGSVTVPRVCPVVCSTEICPTDIPADAGTPGLAMVTLGTPQQWRVQGSFIQFNDPRSWSRITMILMTGDENDCYVSDMVSGGSCWDLREKYLPLHFKVQIVAVSRDREFLGWDNVSWEPSTADNSSETGVLEFFNHEITIVESGKPASDHGAFIRNIAGAPAPAGWPMSFVEPVDFSTAVYYTRFQILETPEPLPIRIMLCITGSDQPPQEICQPVLLPPYNV